LISRINPAKQQNMPSIENIYFSEHKSKNASHLPVVLIHGAGSNHLCWPAEIRRLPDFHTIAIDLPGHGKSSGIGFHDLNSYCQSLFDFLAAAGWYRVFLVGHSMGGAIALQFALDHPEHVIGMSLISSSASFSLKKEIMEALRSPKTSEIAKQYILRNISPQKGLEGWYAAVKKSIQETRDSLFYADYRACMQFDIRSQLENIRVPTQVFAPTNDPLLPYAASAFLATSLANAELIPCYQNGHMLMLESPDFVSQQLHSFLMKIRPPM
jgi:pimeloyl-ACP methyl ester carboxylesterase